MLPYAEISEPAIVIRSGKGVAKNANSALEAIQQGYDNELLDEFIKGQIKIILAPQLES